MTTIGYAALQLIPSLDGFSAAVDKQLGGSIRTVAAKGGKEFGKQFTENAEDGIKRLGDSYAKQYDKMKDAAGKLRTEEQKLQDLRDKGVSGGRLTAQIERAEKARRDEARVVRETTEAYKDLEDAQKRVDDPAPSGGGFLSRLKEAASGAKAAGGEAGTGFLEGLSGPLAALGSKAGPIGLALTAAAGLGLLAGGAIGKQLMQGIENEVATDRIQAQLGLSNFDAAELGKSAGKLYAGNFGESLGDVQQATADVSSTFRGLGGQALEDLTAKAISFRDVFGTEVPESVAFAQNLIVNGLATDATGAFDLIAAAAQRTPAALRDEIPELLSEYNQFFSGLGFSGQQAFGLMVSSAAKGKIYMDKVGDTLKEVSLLATEIGNKDTWATMLSLGYKDPQAVANNLLAGGDTAQAQFQDLIKRLDEIPDKAQQADAALTLFGTPMEDLGKDKIPAFLSALRQGTTAMDGFEGAATNMTNTLGDNTAGSIESAKRSIEVGVTTFQNALAKSFGPALEKIANWISAHSGDIENFFSIAATAVQQFASQFLQVSGEIIAAFGNVVAALADGSGWVIDAFEGLTGGLATVADAVGADGLAGKLRAAHTELGTLSDKLHNTGEDTIGWGNKISEMGRDFGNLNARIGAVVNKVGVLGQSILGLPSLPPSLGGLGNSFDLPPGKAGGGRIVGPGTGISDSILARVSNGEFIINADATRKNLPLLEIINSGRLPGFAGGGPVDVEAARALAGTPYSKESRFDCSGTVARVINAALGLDGGGLMSTKTAEAWLAARGFKPGTGGPGDISVGWYDHGPGENDGHMAMTLSDGTNAEAGGKNSVFTVGAGASGANSPQFDRHMFLTVAKKAPAVGPIVGEGQGATAGPPPPDRGSGGSGGSGALPSSFSDLSAFALNGLGSGVGKTNSGSDLGLFGKAAGSAVSGQVSSALGVFGIGDNPPFLQAASKILGGLQIGGHDPSGASDGSLFNGSNIFGGAGPLSAAQNGTGVIPPDDAGNMHGTRAGQQPGPTYIINARDTEDGFIRAQRLEREKSAAKLAHL